MPLVSKEATIQTLKRIYAKTPDNFISIRDSLIALDRNLEEEDRNMHYFYNIIAKLKKHNLVTVEYEKATTKGRKLKGLNLTLEGQTIMNSERLQKLPLFEEQKRGTVKEISLEELYKMVREVRKANPSFKINFEIIPREEA